MIIIVAWSSVTKQSVYYSARCAMPYVLMSPLFLTPMMDKFFLHLEFYSSPENGKGDG